MIRVGIVGATGYTGVELLRMLSTHPNAKVSVVTSRAEAGRQVSDLFPSLRGVCDLAFSDVDPDELAANCDVVFYATPHATAMHHAEALLARGVKVIDLSADFRIRDQATWEKWYGVEHASAHLIPQAVYGLPERNRPQIATADLIACPGCYPTSVQLGFAPLLEAGVIDPASLIADCKSGVSGAGRKAAVGSLLCESADSIHAYAVSGHRHLPEIKQGLGDFAGTEVGITFVPHLTPMIRGIQATLYATLTTECDLQALFEARYKDEIFVDVMPAGSSPATRSVRGSNVCRLAVHRPQGGDTVVVLAVEDNLVKGAAGQAIQCMNIRFGFNEAEGLSLVGLMP